MVIMFVLCKGRRTLIDYWLAAWLIVAAGVLGPGCRQDPQREAERLIEQGKYKEAVDRLEAVVQGEERGKPLYLLGKAYAGLGEFYQADSYYQRSLSVDSTLRVKVVSGYLSLGDHLLNSRQETAAVRAWERLLSLDPEYDLEDRFYHLGDHYFMNQDYGRAAELYPRALDSSPLSPLARDGRYRLVISLEKVGQLEAAFSWCREGGTEPNRDLLYEEGKIAYLLAEKSLRAGDEERALQLLGRTIELGQPGILLDDAYFLTGEIYFGWEEYERALRSYKAVLRVDPYRKGGIVQKARERIRQVRVRTGAGR